MTLSGEWMATDLVDMLGKLFKVGDKVARAMTSGRAVNLEICDVARIDGTKMYLGTSKVPIYYPGRLLIVNALFAETSVQE